MSCPMINIAECKVSLWLWGDRLDSDELEQWFGQPPAYQTRKGEVYHSEDGEEMQASTGQFQITTGWRTGEALEQVITGLLDQLPNDASLWQKINSRVSMRSYSRQRERGGQALTGDASVTWASRSVTPPRHIR